MDGIFAVSAILIIGGAVVSIMLGNPGGPSAKPGNDPKYNPPDIFRMK